MAFGILLGEYLAWHYSIGVFEIARAWTNIHWFLYHYFSISILLKNLLAPFHRIREARVRGFDPQNLFEVFIINTLMRIVGAVIRMFVIVVGLVAQGVVFVLGALFVAFFLLAPVAVPASIITGIVLIAT